MKRKVVRRFRKRKAQVPGPEPTKVQEQGLHAAVQALQSGCLPSNTQVDEAIQYIQDYNLFDKARLSGHGQTIMENLFQILRTVCPAFSRHGSRVLI